MPFSEVPYSVVPFYSIIVFDYIEKVFFMFIGNELPFRRIFKLHDGGTTQSPSYDGPIGQFFR